MGFDAFRPRLAVAVETVVGLAAGLDAVRLHSGRIVRVRAEVSGVVGSVAVLRGGKVQLDLGVGDEGGRLKDEGVVFGGRFGVSLVSGAD